MAIAVTTHTSAPAQRDSMFAGAGNIFNKELLEWFRTRRFLISTVLVTLLTAFIPIIVFIEEGGLRDGRQVYDADLMTNVLGAWVQVTLTLGCYFVVAMTMGMLTKEEDSGTAHWVFTKPMSRVGYVLAKFAANSLAVIVGTVLIPGIVFVSLVWLGGSTFDLEGTVVVLALSSLHAMFTIALVVFLSSFLSSTGPIAGVAIGLNFIATILSSLVTMKVMGFFPATMTAFAGSVISDMPAGPWHPVLSTIGLTIAGLLIGCYRISRKQLQ